MSFAQEQIVHYIVSVQYSRVLQISDIRVYAQPGTVYGFHIMHGFADCIHEGCFHGLKAHGHAPAGRVGGGRGQVLQEPFFGVGVALFIINIISCQLNLRNIGVDAETDGFFHDLHGTFPNLRIVGSEGIFAVSGQAHGTDRYLRGPGEDAQLTLFLHAPVQPFQTPVCLIYTDLQTVETAVPGDLEHFGKTETDRYGLFI